MKLTKPQRMELKAQRDRGPQPTFGAHRTRTQNVLCAKGLSQFRDDNGRTLLPYYACGDGRIPVTCEITEAGKALLA